MQSIKPSDAALDDEIKLSDFIKIFQNDEVMDNVTKMINNEVRYRRKIQAEKKAMTEAA